jgi:hypothetical protein
MNRSQIADKLEGQIREFSGKLCTKVGGRFVEEMLYGIGLEEMLRDNLIEEGAAGMGRNTLLIIDPSDVSKKYAKKMEYLAQVWDGSENKVSKGYWTMRVIGAELNRVKIIPLYEHLYCQKAPGFVSENEEILKGVDCVRGQVGSRGIWVMDRGGDRRKLFAPFLDRGMRFIIRLEGDRHLVYRGRKVLAIDLANFCRTLYIERIIKEDQSQERAYTVELGFRRVKLPGRKDQLALVGVKGLGHQPLMLLTNLEVVKSRRSLLLVVLSYFRRWQVEETIRFAKQTFRVEDIRLRKYDRLQNMMAIVSVAVYFVAVWLGDRLKLRLLAHHALQAAKRLFLIPDFRYYALADGIKWSFEGSQTPFRSPKEQPRADPQLMLLI